MKENLIIIGTNSTAIDIYHFVLRYDLYNVIGFAVNKIYKKSETLFDIPVYEIENLDQCIDKATTKLFVAILWNRLNSDRRVVYESLKKDGYLFANIISPKAVLYTPIKGDNCWIEDFVFIWNGTNIGNNCYLQPFVCICQDCIIESHCFFAVKSLVGGSCSIGAQSFLGFNSTIFQGVNIGKKCIIGACTAIKRNLPDYSVTKTSHDRDVIKHYTEEVVVTKLMFKKDVR